MSDNLNTDEHRGTIDVLGDHQQKTGVVDEKLGRFFSAYRKFLCRAIGRRLGRRHDDPTVEDCVSTFEAEQIEKIRNGKPNVFSNWDRKRSFRKWLVACCWKSSLRHLGVLRGTPADYEAFRKDLERMVKELLMRPGVPADLGVNVPNYVRVFLEYYSSRHLRPPQNPDQKRTRKTKHGEVESTWREDFQKACRRYVTWWLIRPDFPAWDYLVHRERLLADVRTCVDPRRLPDPAGLETLVDEFLKHYGGQNLCVRNIHGTEQGLPPLPPKMVAEFRKYVVNGEAWRQKYASKPPLGVEAVRQQRPTWRPTEELDFKEKLVGERAARRHVRGEYGQKILQHEPGQDRMNGGEDDFQSPEDREFFNELLLAVVFRYLREHRGTPHAELLRARALEPFAENLSKARPYEEIYARCGFPGETEEAMPWILRWAEPVQAASPEDGKKKDKPAAQRRAELAWSTVQEQINVTLRRELNDRWEDASRVLPREVWVEQQVDEFYRFLETVVRQFDLSPNAGVPGVQDELRRHVRERLHPGASTTSHKEPDLSKCSLGLIAELLLEPGVSRSLKDRQREWGEYLGKPLRAVMNGRPAEAPRDEKDSDAAAETPPRENTPEAEAWQNGLFGDLIHNGRANIAQLKEVKTALGTRIRQASYDLDSNTIAAAYLACIAAALVATGEKITGKKDPELLDDLLWLATEKWIDEKTKELAGKAREKLKELGRAKKDAR